LLLPMHAALSLKAAPQVRAACRWCLRLMLKMQVLPVADTEAQVLLIADAAAQKLLSILERRHCPRSLSLFLGWGAGADIAD